MPRFKVNPGRPSGISPSIDSFVLASVHVKTLATCIFKLLRGYIKLQGVRSPLRPMCCPVYASAMSFGTLSPRFVSPQACWVTGNCLSQHLEFSPALQTAIKPSS